MNRVLCFKLDWKNGLSDMLNMLVNACLGVPEKPTESILCHIMYFTFTEWQTKDLGVSWFLPPLQYYKKKKKNMKKKINEKRKSGSDSG